MRGNQRGIVAEMQFKRPISLAEIENARQSGVCEIGELERVAVNAKSQSPLSVRVILKQTG